MNETQASFILCKGVFCHFRENTELTCVAVSFVGSPASQAQLPAAGGSHDCSQQKTQECQVEEQHWVEGGWSHSDVMSCWIQTSCLKGPKVRLNLILQHATCRICWNHALVLTLQPKHISGITKLKDVSAVSRHLRHFRSTLLRVFKKNWSDLPKRNRPSTFMQESCSQQNSRLLDEKLSCPEPDARQQAWNKTTTLWW